MKEAPLNLIRPEVRGERAYRVPTALAAAKLDQNENPFDLPEELKREIVEHWVSSNWNRYPDDRPHRLIAALSEMLAFPVDGIIVGNGSNEIVHTLGLVMMGEDVPVVLPEPMFALYGSVARMHGANVIAVDPAEGGVAHDVDDILDAAVSSNAAVTVVTTPNNPTGQAFSFEEVQRLAEGVPGFLVVDEAYYEFVDGPTCEALIAEYPNVLVMRTFSKAMGLAGVRLGYLLGDPSVIQEIEKARLPFMVDQGAEAIGLAVLANVDLISERAALLRSERERVEAAVSALTDVDVVSGAANFFLMRTKLSCETICDLLIDEDVRIRNVSGYRTLAPKEGQNGYVRVSVGTPEENDRFIASLECVLEKAALSSVS